MIKNKTIIQNSSNISLEICYTQVMMRVSDILWNYINEVIISKEMKQLTLTCASYQNLLIPDMMQYLHLLSSPVLKHSGFYCTVVFPIQQLLFLLTFKAL